MEKARGEDGVNDKVPYDLRRSKRWRWVLPVPMKHATYVRLPGAGPIVGNFTRDPSDDLIVKHMWPYTYVVVWFRVLDPVRQ